MYFYPVLHTVNEDIRSCRASKFVIPDLDYSLNALIDRVRYEIDAEHYTTNAQVEERNQIYFAPWMRICIEILLARPEFKFVVRFKDRTYFKCFTAEQANGTFVPILVYGVQNNVDDRDINVDQLLYYYSNLNDVVVLVGDLEWEQ